MRRFVSLLMLLAILTACGGPADPEAEIPTLAPGPTAPADDGPVTISFATAEYERTAYEALAEKFTTENPNIKVAIVPIEDLSNVQSPDGQYNPLDVVRSVVSGADTAPANYIYLPPEAMSSGLLLDLKPLMDADSSFQREDFYPGALEQQTIGEQILLLPRYLNVQILTYNKELFKQANLPDPKTEWTWNDLLGAAEQMGKRSGGLGDTFGFFDISGGFMTLAVMLQADGIDLLNTPSQDVQLDQPKIIAAIERLRDLVNSGAIYTPSYGRPEGPSDPNDPNQDPQQIIREGRVGIWSSDFMGMAYSSDGPQQAEPLPYATGKVPYPAGNDLLRGGGFGGEGYFISSGTQYPNQAWKWIEFLSRQPIESNGGGGFGPMPIGGAPGRIPARASLAEQTSFWKDIDEETAAAYKWTIAHPAKPLLRQPDYLAIGALSQVLYQIIPDEKADIAKILGDAQKDLDKQVADMQLTPTPTIDTSPVLVATPEPQTAPEGATTIVFEVNGYNPADIRRIARTFREQHPEIFVQIKSTQSYTEPLSIAKIAQTSDCFTWYAAPQTEEDFKAMLDLQPLFDSDAAFPRDDYPAALLTAYQNGGGLFGLPYSVNLRTLNYNRTAFDAAGAPTPNATWKPEDFLAAAQALTKGEGDKQQYGYVALNGVLSDMLFFAGQFNARLTLGSGVDVRPNFGDPKVVEALQWYINLAKVHKVMPEIKISYRRDDPGFEDKSWEYAQSGRAGMWFAQGPMFNYGDEGGFVKGGPVGQDGPTFEEGISALPLGGAGLSSSDFYARGFHISASSQQAQACWEWLKFLSADTNPNTLQGGIPARTSIAESEAFTKQAPASQVAIYNAYAEALKREGRPGDNPDALYGQMDLYWFYKAIDETLTKDADLAQGLADAQETTTAYLECLEQNGKPLKVATCANQVDPTYQGYNTEDMQDGPPVIGIPRG
jgi:ABC-type glycerol-3-phosphate transport system substrate-binding protein